MSFGKQMPGCLFSLPMSWGWDDGGCETTEQITGLKHAQLSLLSPHVMEMG